MLRPGISKSRASGLRTGFNITSENAKTAPANKPSNRPSTSYTVLESRIIYMCVCWFPDVLVSDSDSSVLITNNVQFSSKFERRVRKVHKSHGKNSKKRKFHRKSIQNQKRARVCFYSIQSRKTGKRTLFLKKLNKAAGVLFKIRVANSGSGL